MASKTTGEDQEQRDRYLKQLGQRLRYFRKLRGYDNYEKFANKHNLNRSQVGRYEAGRSNIEFNTLVKLLLALEVTLAEFFSEGFD